jgi:hypothetical protein
MTDQLDPRLKDFRVFLFLVYKHLGIREPTKRQYEMARFLQKILPRKVIRAFRGIGKSWETAAFVLWLLYWNPQLNILVVSASKQRADNFTTFCLRLIEEVPFLQHLRPRADQRCSKVEFDVGPAEADQNASVRSAGITGQITGSRADVIIADDIEVPTNSATAAMREKLLQYITDFEAILKPHKEAQIIFLGTPQSEESIYNELTNRKYVTLVIPARYPNEAERAEFGDKLSPEILSEVLADPSLVGHTTEPSRFSDELLQEREIAMGKSAFALQFMLSTSLSDVNRYPLRLRDLVVMPLNQEVGPERVIWSGIDANEIRELPCVGLSGDRYYGPVIPAETKYFAYQRRVMAIDPSGRGKDETAFAVVFNLHNNLFLMDAGGFSGGYTPENLEALARLVVKWKVNTVIVEANFGDGMFTALLKPVLLKVCTEAGHRCGVEEVKHHGVQKEKRIIDAVEPVLNGHRLIVNYDLVQRDYRDVQNKEAEHDQKIRYSLFYQLTRLTKERGCLMTDDRIDVTGMAITFFADVMATGTDTLALRSRERLEAAELRKWATQSGLFKSEPDHSRWVPRLPA